MYTKNLTQKSNQKRMDKMNKKKKFLNRTLLFKKARIKILKNPKTATTIRSRKQIKSLTKKKSQVLMSTHYIERNQAIINQNLTKLLTMVKKSKTRVKIKNAIEFQQESFQTKMKLMVANSLTFKTERTKTT
jgi:hypothetical protein